MEAFKLAFETVLVGALAFPWLVLILVLTNPHLGSRVRGLVKMVPDECLPALMGVVAFSLAYVIGSAISPISRAFLNDLHTIGLPTEDSIQASILADLRKTGQGTPTLAAFRENGAAPLSLSDTSFRGQETTVLVHGPEASEELTRLRERLMVLAGATFSGFALALLWGLAWCATFCERLRVLNSAARLRRRTFRVLTYTPAIIVFAVGTLEFILDLKNHDVDDPPIMELIVMLFGLFGLWMAFHPRQTVPSLRGPLLIACFVTVLSYGGFISEEPSYVYQVIRSYQMISPKPASGIYSSTIESAPKVPVLPTRRGEISVAAVRE